MITSLFKNNLTSYILVSIVGGILWGIAYFGADLEVSLSINLANQEYFLSKKLAIIFSFALTFLGVFLLNYKLKKYLFSYEPTNLFLLFYVLITSLGLYSEFLISYSIIAFLLVLLVNYLFYFIENKENEDQEFNSAFIIGLLVFQNVSFLLLIPLLWLNLGAVKRIEIKEVALILIGFLLPSIFVVLFTILTENIEVLSSLFNLEMTYPKLPWKYSLYFLVLIFISFKGYRLVTTKRSGIDINIIRHTRNMFVYFLAILVIMAVSLFMFPKEYIAFLVTIPLSIFLSDYFANSLNKFRELIFLVVILIPFVLSYLN